MKALTVFYSLSGNTKKIADMIRSQVGGDIAEIETAIPYEGDYNAVVKQGKEEIESGFSPKLKPLSVNPAEYDTVILGTPVWWYTFAPAVKSFLEENDLSGKTVYPFATNGGWIGHTFKDFKKMCSGAEVKNGLNIRFDGNTLRTGESDIKNWIEKIK